MKIEIEIANATASGIAQAGSLAALNAASNQHSLNLISQAFLAEAICVDVTDEAVSSKKIAEADLARTILYDFFVVLLK
jgi:hypothetical protein